MQLMQQVFTKVIDILYLAKQNGVEVVLNKERLQLKIAENKVVDKGIVELIKENKEAIIEFLASKNWKSTTINSNHNKITPSDRTVTRNIPLSYSQERLWFIHQLEGSVEYNSPAVLKLRGRLDKAALNRSLSAIVDRHEVLRTVYEDQGGKPYQVIKGAGEWKFGEIEGKQYRDDPEGLRKYVERLMRVPFDLSKDHMLRADLININEEEHVLVVVMHHIASDAWSIPIIIKEVAALYKAYSEGTESNLSALELQYADYAIWQRSYLTAEVLDKKDKILEREA